MAKTTVGIKNDRLKKLFRDMVNIYSPSGKEYEITEFLATYLHEKELPVTLREVNEGRRNVEVVFQESNLDVAFIGHIDTVPAFDIENYEYRDREGEVFGLGAADMKSGCAAMIEAFVSKYQSGCMPQNCGLFLVVGEEESGDGTAALIKSKSFPWAIIAEPTNLVSCLGHYGYLEMLVRVYGTRRHASMAGREYNAIYSMLNMLMKLCETIQTQYPLVVLNIRDIHSSESGFAVPGSCEAYIDLHIPPDCESPKAFARKLKKLVSANLSGDSITGCEIDFPIIADGYNLDDSGMIPEILRKTYKQHNMEWSPGSFNSHSDANLLIEIGCKPIIFGPGQLEKAHTRDESVQLEQVIKAAEMYRTILDNL